MDFSAIIERIPRLNRETLSGLILRQDTRLGLPACYLCEEYTEPLHLFQGRLLCAPCVKMETARGGSPRWLSTRNLFLEELKRRQRR